jgi:hypothetical protein
MRAGELLEIHRPKRLVVTPAVPRYSSTVDRVGQARLSSA